MIWRAATVSVLLATSGAWAEALHPAELPPASYAGQQYVDSKGCMFVRAGRDGEVIWVPRVSRQGVPVCGNPPSGGHVPVVEEIGVQPVPVAEGGTTASALPDTTTEAAAASSGGYFVAVGSFGQAGNAAKAEARLTSLNYGVVRGTVRGESGTLTTIYAGPFSNADSAAAAKRALADAGFPDAVLIGP
ncbi:MAG: SPOR domain-containing protein [Acetobacteraceae bacterium]|nr:MAG: SPOR domain-containing protein [Acetobacteraceae bacterium]